MVYINGLYGLYSSNELIKQVHIVNYFYKNECDVMLNDAMLNDVMVSWIIKYP